MGSVCKNGFIINLRLPMFLGFGFEDYFVRMVVPPRPIFPLFCDSYFRVILIIPVSFLHVDVVGAILACVPHMIIFVHWIVVTLCFCGRCCSPLLGLLKCR